MSNDDDAAYSLRALAELDASQATLAELFIETLASFDMPAKAKQTRCMELIDHGMPLNVLGPSGEALINLVCNQKLTTLAAYMYEHEALVDYDTLKAAIREESCPDLALEILADMRDVSHDLHALQQVLDESYNDAGDDNTLEIRPAAEAFAQHVLLPAAMLDAGYATNPNMRTWFESRSEAQVDELISELGQVAEDYLIGNAPILEAETDLSPTGDFARHLFLSTRLARTWHHPAIQFPQHLLTVLPQRQWHPLFEGTYTALNGYTIRCVTSTAELKQLGSALDNCLDKGEYARDCCAAASDYGKHLLRIDTPNGQPIAIAELDVSNHGVRVVQQELSNAKPLAKGPAFEAMGEWVRTQRGKQLLGTPIVNSESLLGETAQSREQFLTIPPIYRATGYEPDWQQVNACFDEYKQPYRRAAIRRGKSNSRFEITYDDVQDIPHLWTGKLKDGYTNMRHFIPEVSYKNGADSLSMRNMDVPNWLVASGLIEPSRRLLEEIGMPPPDYEIDLSAPVEATHAAPQTMPRNR